MIHIAEDARGSVIELMKLQYYIRDRKISDEEYDRCEPRIRLSYGTYTVEMPNIAQTYNAFTDAIEQMIREIKDAGF